VIVDPIGTYESNSPENRSTLASNSCRSSSGASFAGAVSYVILRSVGRLVVVVSGGTVVVVVVVGGTTIGGCSVDTDGTVSITAGAVAGACVATLVVAGVSVLIEDSVEIDVEGAWVVTGTVVSGTVVVGVVVGVVDSVIGGHVVVSWVGGGATKTGGCVVAIVVEAWVVVVGSIVVVVVDSIVVVVVDSIVVEGAGVEVDDVVVGVVVDVDDVVVVDSGTDEVVEVVEEVVLVVALVVGL
jgi:hypothetical protein